MADKAIATFDVVKLTVALQRRSVTRCFRREIREAYDGRYSEMPRMVVSVSVAIAFSPQHREAPHPPSTQSPTGNGPDLSRISRTYDDLLHEGSKSSSSDPYPVRRKYEHFDQGSQPVSLRKRAEMPQPVRSDPEFTFALK